MIRMNWRVTVFLVALFAGCTHSATTKMVPPTSQPAGPISVTVTRGDFVVVGKQDHGIAVYLTIDRREKSCLVEVQNATEKRISVLDSWTDLSIYRGVGFMNLTSEASTTQAVPPTPATLMILLPSQVVRGSLSLPITPVHQQIRLRLYYEDSHLGKWMDVESPEFDVIP